MPKAQKSRPCNCPVCKRKIKKGDEYRRCIRYVRAGETPTPGLARGRIVQEIHESCVDAWEEKFMPERHRRKNRKKD